MSKTTNANNATNTTNATNATNANNATNASKATKKNQEIDYLKLLHEGCNSKAEILAMMKKPTRDEKCSDCGEYGCYGYCEVDRCNCKGQCKSEECLGTIVLERMSERNGGHKQYYVVEICCMECEKIGCACCKQCKLFYQCNCHGQLDNSDDDNDNYSDYDYDERDPCNIRDTYNQYDAYDAYDAELEYEARQQEVEYNSRLGYDAYDPELENDAYDPERDYNGSNTYDAHEIYIDKYGSYEEYIRQRDAARNEERRQEREEFNREMDRLEREDEEREREEYEREREDEEREMYELDTDPVIFIRSTCEYRPEEEVHDPRFDILSMDLDDPYFIPNPVLEDYDARLEQEYIRCEEECEEREEFDIDFTPEVEKTVSKSHPSITVASLTNESILIAHAVEIVRKGRRLLPKLNPDHPEYETDDDIDSDNCYCDSDSDDRW